MPDKGDIHVSGGSAEGDDPKVIVLREHQVAERLLDDLLIADFASPGYTLLLARASMLGAPLLSAVTRRLDAFNPRSLDMLGKVVAVYPDVRKVVSSLRRTANDRRLADRRRMGAVMLLEQAFGLQPPDDFLATLQEPVQSATGLLLGALDNHVGNPTALRDYLRALVFQPLDLLYSVLGALAEAGDDRTVDVLRLLALQPDPDLQLGAIETLGGRGTERALRALCVLEFTLPADTARAANRHLQKLRLSGADVATLRKPVAACRAWVSAIDGRGDRLLWLAAPQVETVSGYTVLGLLINDVSGVLDAVGAGGVQEDALPPISSVGTLLPTLDLTISGVVSSDTALGEQTGGYLTIPFTYALRLLRDAVASNWSTGTPLPIEYQLLNASVWEYGGGLSASGDGEDSSPDDLAALEATSGASESDLLFDNLFDSWYLEGPSVRAVAKDVSELGGTLPHELSDDNWRMLLPALIRLAHDEFGTELRTRYAARLRRMAEWLEYASRPTAAEMAYQCAHTMIKSPPEANLFVLRLVQKGILMALAELRPN
ncbi:MAG: HEAT repeat domain-containing protein [Chloroflexia bacterium]